jgi:hypothetical protein
MDLNEIDCYDVDWIKLTQHQFQWRDFIVAVMTFVLPLHKQACLFDKYADK